MMDEPEILIDALEGHADNLRRTADGFTRVGNRGAASLLVSRARLAEQMALYVGNGAKLIAEQHVTVVK